MLEAKQASSAPTTAMREDTFGHAPRKPFLPTARSRTIKGPLSALGMAIGYLGLVAILGMAPFWLQSAVPQQSNLLVCTDFGGSR